MNRAEKRTVPFDHIEIVGAAEHNLRNISLRLPHHSLIVITGVSGSGKSSLAYDTLYKEGQRRFIESLSAYARQFLGGIDKPRVEKIEGISPTVCIDQKRRGHSSRSTVGTVTAVLDYLRLLFARLGTPHCPDCRVEVCSQSTDQIARIILERYAGRHLLLLAPVVVARKGEYRKEFAKWQAEGFLRVRLDGEIKRLDEEIRIDRYEKHSIELVLDRVEITPAARVRVREGIEHATRLGRGTVAVATDDEFEMFSVHRACPYCGFSIPELEPRMFSFNNPQGACPVCEGRGVHEEFDPVLIVPDPELSISEGAVTCLNKEGNILFSDHGIAEIKRLVAHFEHCLATPWRNLPEALQRAILYGSFEVGRELPPFQGLIPVMEKLYRKWNLAPLRRFVRSQTCHACRGKRLRLESLHVLFRDHDIARLCEMRIAELLPFLRDVKLSEREETIGREIFDELRRRLTFLKELGLSYLTLDRRANTLAGGEMQRIRLASQLGSGLQGVLYILDEPSIGLHARDNAQLLASLRGLKDMGNTVVVIEHDEETMRAADHIVDMGPGAGRKGGEVVSQGDVSEIEKCRDSLTGQYLLGRQRIPIPEKRRAPGAKWLKILGAREHNLKDIDVAVPLGLLVAVTGVSGSGKSTLIDEILYKALSRRIRDSGEIPGEHRGIEGVEWLEKVVEVDQSPIGRNPRSNPATYIKVFDEIRALFSVLPDSKTRGYPPGRFSFNVEGAGGRCSLCNGLGYKEVEMQFLPNVWVPCEQCAGKRFNRETLEIRYRDKNISEILDMTVAEAAQFFENHPKIAKPLDIMLEVGMGYVKLGQPSPTLSGGESQRIKLVRELERGNGEGTLYILDEPTTGLHLKDVSLLLGALHRLVDQGSTVLVIEHHLDVVKVADWVIDLGPEGGEEGGTVVVAGPPETVAACAASHTGEVLARHLARESSPGRGRRNRAGSRRKERVQPAFSKNRDIVIRGATKNNLKNITVTIPWQTMTVVTGVSGSGKSSLVLDTLFAEGQRTFIESMSTYARRFLGRFDHGEVDSVEGLAPVIAIDQKSASNNPRSTVATMTEIYDYLRVIYARIGVSHCPECGRQLTQYTPSSAAEKILSQFKGASGTILAPLYIPGARKDFALSTAAKLKDYAAHLEAEGFSRVWIEGETCRLDELPQQLKRRPIHLVIDRIRVQDQSRSRCAEAVETAFKIGHGVAFFHCVGEVPLDLSTVPACVACDHYQTEELHPRMFSFNHYLGACPACDGLGFHRHGEGELCEDCHGKRLRPEYLAVTVGGLSITGFCEQNVSKAKIFLEQLSLPPHQANIARDAVSGILHRLSFLKDVGVDYLTLDRRGDTLAGGEAQRIRLATQIGNRLVGVIYVLDEPTVGLHPVDTNRLVTTLRDLVDMGNTVVMVEHDPLCIEKADHVIDMGPGAGHEGGEVIAASTPRELKKYGRSATGQYLSGKLRVLIPPSPKAPERYLEIHKAHLHNLKDIDVRFPLQKLTAVTGVSGSGKSTLVVEILEQALSRHFAGNGDLGEGGTGFEAITGMKHIQHVSTVDQTPLARTPGSSLATYCDMFTPIREFFAQLPGSRVRGFTPARFSFNRPGGRCEVCEGRGVIEVPMHFLSDVWVPCEACHGRRYLEETLSVHYRGKDIAQVLDMDVTEASAFFASHRKITRKLAILQDIGLGYMKLGQTTNTLSGGEAQRLKLARELATTAGDTLYILDEPTTGLHPQDVQKLLEVLHHLICEGNTAIVIEHNLDVIRCADWIVDLGPDGGDCGGEVLCCGTLLDLLARPGSRTGEILRQVLGTPAPEICCSSR